MVHLFQCDWSEGGEKSQGFFVETVNIWSKCGYKIDFYEILHLKDFENSRKLWWVEKGNFHWENFRYDWSNELKSSQERLSNRINQIYCQKLSCRLRAPQIFHYLHHWKNKLKPNQGNYKPDCKSTHGRPEYSNCGQWEVLGRWGHDCKGNEFEKWSNIDSFLSIMRRY